MLLTGFSTVFGKCSSIFIGFPLVNNQPIVINDYLAKENAFPWVASPFASPSLIFMLAVLVFYQKRPVRKWHLFSIFLHKCGGLFYAVYNSTVDQIICMVSKYGPRGLMAK